MKTACSLSTIVLALCCVSTTARATGLAADANGDGVVDLDDFVAMKLNFGAGGGATVETGDFDDDGDVDLDDFVILKRTFGARAYYLDADMGADAGDGTAAVPWRTWARAQSMLAAGDVLYCAGALGRVDITAADPTGTASRPIVYAAWPLREAPHVT